MPEFDGGVKWFMVGADGVTLTPLSDCGAERKREGENASAIEIEGEYPVPHKGIAVIRADLAQRLAGGPSSPTISEVEAETRAAVERIKRDHRTGELGGED